MSPQRCLVIDPNTLEIKNVSSRFLFCLVWAHDGQIWIRLRREESRENPFCLQRDTAHACMFWYRVQFHVEARLFSYSLENINPKGYIHNVSKICYVISSTNRKINFPQGSFITLKFSFHSDKVSWIFTHQHIRAMISWSLGQVAGLVIDLCHLRHEVHGAWNTIFKKSLISLSEADFSNVLT